LIEIEKKTETIEISGNNNEIKKKTIIRIEMRVRTKMEIE
jgi:hypothetical protein